MGRIDVYHIIVIENEKRDKICKSKKFLHKYLYGRWFTYGIHSLIKRVDASGSVDIIYRLWHVLLLCMTGIVNKSTVADLEGGEPAPPPPLPGRRTDAVSHGTPDMWQRYCIMATPSPFLSLQTLETLHSEYFRVIAISGFLTALECTTFFFGRGSASNPTGGAYIAPPDPLAGLRGPTSKGDGRDWTAKREGKGRGRESEGIEGTVRLCKCLDTALVTN